MPVWYGHYNDSLNNEINMTLYASDDLNSFVAQVSWLTWGREFLGDHLILGEQKGGSVVTENPKGRIA